MLEIEFRDRGCGIDNVERIFDAFYTTKNDGMGMGLSICRSIIETHGGGIWAVDTPEGGATVTFSLPVGPVESKAAPKPEGTYHHVERTPDSLYTIN